MRILVRPKPQKKKTPPKDFDQDGYFRLKGKLKHRKVWVEAFGPIPRGWIVHHINRRKLDNRLENLLAMPRQAHSELHKMIHRGYASFVGNRSVTMDFLVQWMKRNNYKIGLETVKSWKDSVCVSGG